MTLLLLILAVAGCGSPQRPVSITISHNNLSDSYLYPISLVVNDEMGFPGGEVKSCSNGEMVGSSADIYLSSPPRFVTVEWAHLLSGRFYRAKVELDPRASEWLNAPPFELDPRLNHTYMIVQWRGTHNVAVMLVANYLDFSRGRVDLGKAEGVEIQRPEYFDWRENTYEDMRDKANDRFIPGTVFEYKRRYDGELSRKQRFGCPRDGNGNVDETQLPPAKLPFMIGRHGEHIPCNNYFCTDKEALKNALLKLDSARYPPNSNPPASIFRDAPNPEPAW